MEKNRNEETKLMEALSFAMYGRGMQNRCSLLNSRQRDQLKAMARDMGKQNQTQQPSEKEILNKDGNLLPGT